MRSFSTLPNIKEAQIERPSSKKINNQISIFNPKIKPRNLDDIGLSYLSQQQEKRSQLKNIYLNLQ